VKFIKMADTQEERLKRDEQIRETIMAKLVESGEKDKLKEMLRDRLIQCGWRDELKEHCKDIIRRKGLEKVTVEELVAEITPHGRGKLSITHSLFIFFYHLSVF
jgi:enhancer of yellow 2 transcription factor